MGEKQCTVSETDADRVGRLERRVGCYDCHFHSVTYQSLIATQMISIYISYELIHACLRPPRTPIPHAVLLSLLKIASIQFFFGRWYQFIAGRLGDGV